MDSVRRHQCLIYEKSPSDHLRALAKSIDANLKAHRRCLYLNSPPMVAGMRCSLAAEGVELTSEIEKGTLILTSDQGHLINGIFEVEKMLSMLKDALNQAIADGYEGLFASGDISWEFGGENNFDKLLEYEQRLDQFMQENELLSGVCQYSRKTLPLEAANTAVVVHPALYVNETLSQINSQYKSQSA